MIVDTSALLSYFYENETQHDETVAAIEGAEESLVVSPFVMAELDYLVMTRHGVRHELAVLSELASGAWELATIGQRELTAIHGIMAQYGDTTLGIADISNVVLADVYRTSTIATLDRRHFTALRLADGTFPVLVP